MKTLILYSSRSGQTEKIARHIASVLDNPGAQSVTRDIIASKVAVTLINLHEVTMVDLSQYQCVVIGASIRYGHFHKSLNAFIKKHYQMLNAMPGAFYSVNLTARKAEKRTPQTNIYTRKFLQSSLWQPDLCDVFAGAVRYPQYTWYQRLMVRLIMTITGGETDTTKEIEYTDWQQVSHFARQISSLFNHEKLEK